jgi:hypothetical protein
MSLQRFCLSVILRKRFATDYEVDEDPLLCTHYVAATFLFFYVILRERKAIDYEVDEDPLLYLQEVIHERIHRYNCAFTIKPRFIILLTSFIIIRASQILIAQNAHNGA